MFNKEATQWPPYIVEYKRGIPTCITPNKECMIDRREMPNARQRFDAELACQWNLWKDQYLILLL